MHFYCGNVFKVKCLNVFLSVTNKMFTNEQSERSASDKISPSSTSGRGGGGQKLHRVEKRLSSQATSQALEMSSSVSSLVSPLNLVLTLTYLGLINRSKYLWPAAGQPPLRSHLYW